MKKVLGVLVLTLSPLVLAACASSGPNSPQPNYVGHDDTSHEAPFRNNVSKVSRADDVGHDDTTGEASLRSSLSNADYPGHDDTTGEAPLRSTLSEADDVGHDDTTGEAPLRSTLRKADQREVPSQPASTAAQTADSVSQ